MTKSICVVLATVGCLAAQPVLAQPWGGDRDDTYNGYNSDRFRYGNSNGNSDWLTRSVCSGQRARNLEQELNREEQEGGVDEDNATNIHSQIDQLEERQQEDCNNGDWRDLRVVANQFDRLDNWINEEARGNSYSREY